MADKEYSLKRSTEKSNLTFMSSNHPNHPFESCPSNQEWQCDGKSLFGSCKSNINYPGAGFGMIRYRCKICPNFNFCEKCLRSAAIQSTPNEIIHSANHAHPLRFCLGDERWRCDGETVFGRCKAETRNIQRVNRFKCTVCANFDLCDQCL